MRIGELAVTVGVTTRTVRHYQHLGLLPESERLAVGARTDVTIELSAPVPHFTLLGRERRVRLVRLHADDPDALAQALTRARTVPSPSPGRPG